LIIDINLGAASAHRNPKISLPLSISLTDFRFNFSRS